MQPSASKTLPPGYGVTTITCDGSSNTSVCAGPGSTVTVTGLTCTPLPKHKTFTVFSIVHTSTVTVYGNQSNFTLPYEPIVTPDYCNPTVYPLVPGFTPISTIDSSLILMKSGDEVYTSSVDYVYGGFPTLPTIPILVGATATAIITDKNPAVVTSPDPKPTRTRSVWPGGQIDHKPPAGNEPQGVNQEPITVSAGRDTVIINRYTYSNLGPGHTTTVTVDNGAVFTIGPTAVIGQGASISRPTPDGQPTPTHVGGLPVTVQPSNVVIGGGTFAIPTAATTANVNGLPVVIAPDSVTINGETYSFSRPGLSNAVIAGGELMTAIGKSVVVLHSTTFTYGPSASAIDKTVNGDTVIIGPTAISVHGSIMGGPSAEATETDYEIVGGATIARLPPSMFVINSKTYAVGPSANMRTVVIGDQTITLGPMGLVMATTTMPYPFNADVVTTISPSGNGHADPQETGASEEEEEDAAFSIRPDRRVGAICLCIAIGAWVLG